MRYGECLRAKWAILYLFFIMGPCYVNVLQLLMLIAGYIIYEHVITQQLISAIVIVRSESSLSSQNLQSTNLQGLDSFLSQSLWALCLPGKSLVWTVSSSPYFVATSEGYKELHHFTFLSYSFHSVKRGNWQDMAIMVICFNHCFSSFQWAKSKGFKWLNCSTFVW
jgi:hypothetical protein